MRHIFLSKIETKILVMRIKFAVAVVGTLKFRPNAFFFVFFWRESVLKKRNVTALDPDQQNP